MPQWKLLVGPMCLLKIEEALMKIDSKLKDVNPGTRRDRSGVG
jgi:hypothetical protein